jgi:hypothetical protein
MISIALGSLIGILYGLSFVNQQKRALSIKHTTFTRHLISAIVLSSARCTIFALCIVYILHSPSINPILILLSFALTLWYIVRNKKA